MPAVHRYLPVLDRTPRRVPEHGSYLEKELTTPVDLCSPDGSLNREAVGWSRTPLVSANIEGRWPRKKRWNFWNWIGRRFSLSAVVADIDYASFLQYVFIDFESGEEVEGIDVRRPGFVSMPVQVDVGIVWESDKALFTIRPDGEALEVELDAPVGGRRLKASLRVHKPRDHQSLNVVVPWTDRLFQLNSKHNTLRTEGAIQSGDRVYDVDGQGCHAVQDWGRGVWPYRSCWNWAVCTGEVDGELVGINLGDRWTTGTGSNENGLMIGGRLHKIMEDIDWDYDAENWWHPWTLRTQNSDTVDLTLRPFHVHSTRLNAGILSTGGTNAFGSWHGRIRADGRELVIDGQVGWAEEFVHRW